MLGSTEGYFYVIQVFRDVIRHIEASVYGFVAFDYRAVNGYFVVSENFLDCCIESIIRSCTRAEIHPHKALAGSLIALIALVVSFYLVIRKFYFLSSFN